MFGNVLLQLKHTEALNPLCCFLWLIEYEIALNKFSLTSVEFSL